MKKKKLFPRKQIRYSFIQSKNKLEYSKIKHNFQKLFHNLFRIKMDIPRFPAPPASLVPRSVSLDCNPDESSKQRQQRQLRRPRSASWLVARKQSRRNRRPNHVQPLASLQPKILGGGPNYRMSTELKLTVSEQRNNKREEEEEDEEEDEEEEAEEEEEEEEKNGKLGRIRCGFIW